LNPAIHKNTASGQTRILIMPVFSSFISPLVCLHWRILYSKQLIIKILPSDFEGEEKSFPEN